MKLTGKIAQEGLQPFINQPVVYKGRKIPRIWVLVADKTRARIFRKPDGHLELIGEGVPDETLQAELTNKTVGRGQSGGGRSVHHKYEPHMMQSRQDEFTFANDIAEWLDKAVEAGAFDRLVLVAEPRMLGDLREVLSEKVEKRLAAEVDKNLTKLDEKALYAALEDILWF